MTLVRYTHHETGAQVTLELQGDPMQVCEAVRERMHPDVPADAPDPRFDAMIKARKAAEK